MSTKLIWYVLSHYISTMALVQIDQDVESHAWVPSRTVHHHLIGIPCKKLNRNSTRRSPQANYGSATVRDWILWLKFCRLDQQPHIICRSSEWLAAKLHLAATRAYQEQKAILSSSSSCPTYICSVSWLVSWGQRFASRWTQWCHQTIYIWSASIAEANRGTTEEREAIWFKYQWRIGEQRWWEEWGQVFKLGLHTYKSGQGAWAVDKIFWGLTENVWRCSTKKRSSSNCIFHWQAFQTWRLCN